MRRLKHVDKKDRDVLVKGISNENVSKVLCEIEDLEALAPFLDMTSEKIGLCIESLYMKRTQKGKEDLEFSSYKEAKHALGYKEIKWISSEVVKDNAELFNPKAHSEQKKNYLNK